MVAHDRAAEAGRDGDAHHLADLIREDVDDDRDQDAEGAPGGTRRKRDAAADQEQDGREQRAVVAAAHDGFHEIIAAERVGHAGERPCKGEDQDGRDHRLKAFRNAVGELLEREHLAAEEEGEAEQQRNEGAEHKADGSIGICERIHEVRFAVEEAASIDHAADAGNDEDDHGEHQVYDLALVMVLFIVIRRLAIGTRSRGKQVAAEFRVVLMELHGAEVEVHQRKGDHHGDGQQRIEVVRNGLKEHQEAVDARAVRHGGRDRRRPGADRRDDAHRGCRCIDNIRELRAGYLVLIGHGQHHGADREAVEIVIDEDQAAERDRRKLCARAGLDLMRRPLAEGSGAARLVHQAYHNAQDDEEDQDAYVPSVAQLFRHHFENAGDRMLQAVTARRDVLQHAAHHDADEQRSVNLFCDQSKADCDDRRQQGPEGSISILSQASYRA